MRGRAAVLSLLAGLVVVAGSQLSAPLGSPPLFDGVVVQEPYRYLAPEPSQAGSPTSVTSSFRVEGTTAPVFAVATKESPPQAQLIVPRGVFVLSPSVTSLSVSIRPVAAPALPSSGTIAGNVYRFSAVDQSGAPLAIGQVKKPTLLLRAPDGVFSATIAHFADGRWQELSTLPGGQPGTFLTNIAELGDFGLIVVQAAGPFGLDPPLLIGAIAVALLSVLALGAFMSRRDRPRTPPSPSRPGRPMRSRPRRGGRGGRSR
jgi:hypothetical protein